MSCQCCNRIDKVEAKVETMGEKLQDVSETNALLVQRVSHAMGSLERTCAKVEHLAEMDAKRRGVDGFVKIATPILLTIIAIVLSLTIGRG